MSIPRRLALITLVAALVLGTFTWPSARLEPRDLPIGVVAPQAAADGAPSAGGATEPTAAPPAAGRAADATAALPPTLTDRDAYDVHVYASEAEAREAVRDRDVYGALSGSTVFVATGASPAVAAALRSAAPRAAVVDLAPGTERDPRASTLASLALPLTLLGIVVALLAFFTARTARERVGLILVAATVSGLLGALYAQTVLDALPGAWLAIAGVVALTVAAIAAFVAGLASHVGRPGIGIGAVLMMLVANPWSGITSAPHLLPEPAGTIGQLLPTGAAGNLLRSVAYFGGAAAGPYLVVLGAWAVAGLALIATAALRRRGAVAHHAAPVAA